jgi:hypothetical protein
MNRYGKGGDRVGDGPELPAFTAGITAHVSVLWKSPRNCRVRTADKQGGPERMTGASDAHGDLVRRACVREVRGRRRRYSVRSKRGAYSEQAKESDSGSIK